MITYCEPPFDLLLHYVVLNMFQIQIVFKLVGSWVIPPLKHLIKPTTSCIDRWWVQQCTCFLNHGFIILPFFILTPPFNNEHVNNPNPFHVYTPCLWPTWCVKAQCCGMVVWRLNCSYKHQWNGALHCEHPSLPPSKWLGIVNGTCVSKCPKSMHLLFQMGINK
jgi:hypothetical protein